MAIKVFNKNGFTMIELISSLVILSIIGVMAGMGLAMIKRIMKHKNVMTLQELIAQAKFSGVKLVVCTMSMDLMGIKKEELIDGVEEGGVAMYIDHLSCSGANLFIS